MSYPFGGTRLSAYLTWAAESGCKCQNGYNESGTTFWYVEAPSGRSVYIADMDQSEVLLSSQLNHLDRRLGLKSPFDRVGEV